MLQFVLGNIGSISAACTGNTIISCHDDPTGNRPSLVSVAAVINMQCPPVFPTFAPNPYSSHGNTRKFCHSCGPVGNVSGSHDRLYWRVTKPSNDHRVDNGIPFIVTA
jgi:hypothetical protein